MLGLEAKVLNHAPLPFHTGPALRFRGQAQFNPARYLVGLATAVIDRGGQIFEASRTPIQFLTSSLLQLVQPYQTDC